MRAISESVFHPFWFGDSSAKTTKSSCAGHRGRKHERSEHATPDLLLCAKTHQQIIACAVALQILHRAVHQSAIDPRTVATTKCQVWNDPAH
jgi:hypothetical protein